MTPLTPDETWRAVVAALRDLMAEQEQQIGEVSPDTCLLADLGVSSIDMIHLMVTLEDRVDHPLDFGELATGPDGQLRRDLTLGELAAFVAARVGTGPASRASADRA
ncbi:MAG: acyl carrier protein [Vicinamibacterales bacterium]